MVNRSPSQKCLNLLVTFSLLALVILMSAGTTSSAASSGSQDRSFEATSALGRTLAKEFRKLQER